MQAAEPTTNERIWQVVAAIPRGQVATYGEVAIRAGMPRGARRVGNVLRQLPKDSRLPWHRVVNAQGRISLPAGSPSARLQRLRLEDEGVCFKLNGAIDLRRFRWD